MDKVFVVNTRTRLATNQIPVFLCIIRRYSIVMTSCHIQKVSPFWPMKLRVVGGVYEYGEHCLRKWSYGSIWRGTGLHHKSVCVEVIEKAMLQTQKDLPTLRKEAKTQASFRHHGLARVYDIFESPTQLILVQDHLDCRRLDKVVALSQIAEDMVRHYFQQIVSVVCYIQKAGLFHRSLRLDQCFVRDNDEIVIMNPDFGVPFQEKADDTVVDLNTGALDDDTKAPEELQNFETTATSDVWRLGLVLYSLVTGHMPFSTGSASKKQDIKELIQAVAIEYPPDIPSEVHDLLSKILVANPMERLSLEEVINHPWCRKSFVVDPGQECVPLDEVHLQELDEDPLPGRLSKESIFQLLAVCGRIHLERFVWSDVPSVVTHFFVARHDQKTVGKKLIRLFEEEAFEVTKMVNEWKLMVGEGDQKRIYASIGFYGGSNNRTVVGIENIVGADDFEMIVDKMKSVLSEAPG